MELKCITTVALLYYTPALLAGGADVFSNTEGKTITLYRDGIYKTKNNNKKQIHKDKHQFVKKYDRSKKIAKSN